MITTDPGAQSPEVIHHAPGGPARDATDDQQARDGRERHEGFKIGQFLQAPPFFFTADHHPIPLCDMYRGGTLFLIASGPSFHRIVDTKKLSLPGIITLGVNNSVKSFRPNLWTSVDSPQNFLLSTWLDPKIQKFVPICHTQKKLFNSITWKEVDTRVCDCPNVVYYKRNEHFQASQFLYEDTFNWGNHKNYGGGRSILLVAVRLAFMLGFRRVYLLGVDFEMKPGQKNYHFEQDRSASSIAGNNSTYSMLKDRFTQLKPYFDKEGFEVFNCNPDSALKVFPYVPFHAAIDSAIKRDFANIHDVTKEPSEGLYDRIAKLEEAEKQKSKAAAAATAKDAAKATAARYTDDDRRDVKQRLDSTRHYLDAAKKALETHCKQQPVEPGATADAVSAWTKKKAELETAVSEARNMFRTTEDEKRFKHGEGTKWGLWKDPGVKP